jgi:hypothetical protein
MNTDPGTTAIDGMVLNIRFNTFKMLGHRPARRHLVTRYPHGAIAR